MQRKRGPIQVAARDIQLRTEHGIKADGFLESGASLRSLLPPRPVDAHKGLFGHVLAVGGDLGMGGALRLTAEAALRAGAGLVSAVTRSQHVAAVLAALPEVMVSGCDDLADWPVPVASRANVLALGPGMGVRGWGKDLFGRAIRSPARAGVIDADALNLLADHAASYLPSGPEWVLTPHPGEAARLLGCSSADVQADRFAAARGIADRWRATVVLKGAGSVVVAPDGSMCVIDAGNPGLAVAGSGDVLTGVIAALLGQGLSAFDAARLGAYLHAAAGDQLVLSEGERGLLASDLPRAVRRRINT